jgi:3-phenylpropionate/trans-cinnamate dioxygenase ferredoxin subunit
MSSQWVDVAGANEVSDQPLALFENGVAFIVVRCGDSLYAVDNMCTHDGETFGEAQVEDCQVICPRHGAHFCLKTGAALTPPAYEAVRTYPAREENGRVLVELPG